MKRFEGSPLGTKRRAGSPLSDPVSYYKRFIWFSFDKCGLALYACVVSPFSPGCRESRQPGTFLFMRVSMKVRIETEERGEQVIETRSVSMARRVVIQSGLTLLSAKEEKETDEKQLDK
jgi:hypothetical protein